MNDRELLQKALEALNNVISDFGVDDLIPLHNEIEARLAEPEPEPVAWMQDLGDDMKSFTQFKHVADSWGSDHKYTVQPLYTHPQPERKPLSEDVLRDIIERECGPVMRISDMEWAVAVARAIEREHEIK